MHVSLHRRDVDRRRQIVDDRIEQRLHALVLERGAAEHGHDVVADGRRADRVANLVVRELFAAEILLDDRLVVRDGGVDHVVARLFRGLVELGRNVA